MIHNVRFGMHSIFINLFIIIIIIIIIIFMYLSHDVTSGSEITPRNKIDKPIVVYRFSNVTK